jgi:hypothetical protein
MSTSGRCALSVPLLLLCSTWLPSPARAEDPSGSTTLSTDQLDTDYYHQEGDLVTRFGVNVGAFAGIGDEGIDLADSLNIGIFGGLGYFPIDQLSADIDLSTALNIDDGLDISTFVITPGSRIYPLREVFLRVGLPIVVTDPSSVNGLVGAGYEYRITERQTLTGELALTYPFSCGQEDCGGGVITLGGGTTYTF